MPMTDLEILKMNLQEKTFPYFSDSELQGLLEQYGTVKEASYQGCMMKAQDDSVKLGPINTASNEKYWLRRARMYRTNATGTMQRADES